jgi:two-component system LytT family response regulator/two-component system response regulator LytT
VNWELRSSAGASNEARPKRVRGRDVSRGQRNPKRAAAGARLLVESGPGVAYTWAAQSEISSSLAMNINTVIVDDEKPARDELAYLLKSFPEISLVGQGKNGVEAVSLIKEHTPDLVFLDVQMPGLNGFGVIKKLVDRKLKVPHIVFATAYDNYAVQAFEVNAVDYVLKPFDKGRVAKAIQRAKKMLEAKSSPAERIETLVSQLESSKSAQRTKLLVKTQQRLFLVDADDVVYASIEDGLITVVARDIEGCSNYRTIEELQASLDTDVFWRAHRSYLVNINHIKEVVPWFKSSYMLKMDDKKQSEVPVSRAQTKRLRELLKM